MPTDRVDHGFFICGHPYLWAIFEGGLYDWMYRHNRVPWDIGPRKEMVEVVGNGRIQPGRAIDASAMLSTGRGCGTDYSPAAITLCQERGAAAGLAVEWIEDNLTNLQHVKGTFDLLMELSKFCIEK